MFKGEGIRGGGLHGHHLVPADCGSHHTIDVSHPVLLNCVERVCRDDSILLLLCVIFVYNHGCEGRELTGQLGQHVMQKIQVPVKLHILRVGVVDIKKL